MKNKRKLFIAAIIVGICSVSILAGVSLAAEKAIKLKFSSVSAPPDQSFHGETAKWWMDKVTERTNGWVTFQTFWGASLGSGPGHIDLVEKGMADVILGSRIYAPGKFPIGAFLFAIPFGPTDMRLVSQARRRIHEEFPAFRENLAAHNIILLGNFVTSPYNICSKTPIKTLDDLKGKKIGLIGRYFGRWVKPVGAIPVVAPMHDRYTLLQTDVTQVDFHPIENLNAYKVQELAPYYVEINSMIGDPWDLMMNLKTFGSLPSDIQKIFVNTGKEAELVLTEQLAPRYIERVSKEWKKQGVKFAKLPEEEREKWASMLEDIPAEWAAEVAAQRYPGWEIIERYLQLAEAGGYKWPRKWGVKK